MRGGQRMMDEHNNPVSVTVPVITSYKALYNAIKTIYCAGCAGASSDLSRDSSRDYCKDNCGECIEKKENGSVMYDFLENGEVPEYLITILAITSNIQIPTQ
jgi:hypothetical protein